LQLQFKIHINFHKFSSCWGKCSN